jgi:hypothetical protein
MDDIARKEFAVLRAGHCGRRAHPENLGNPEAAETDGAGDRRSPSASTAGALQWQPQVLGVQRQPPEAAVVEDSADDLLPFAGAAKTESWIVCSPLAHLGQVMAVLLFITIRS